jgi:excisionase family DNA binding protein
VGAAVSVAVPAVLTVAEAAAFLRVSEDTVLRHRAELGGFKLGRSVRFRRDRLEAFTAAPVGRQVALSPRRAAPMRPEERKAWRARLRRLAKPEPR